MDKNDEIRQARQEGDSILKRIREAKAGKMNSGLEAQYGQAYQRRVRLGDAPQLRGKYRG
jgi:hypothetical protein